MDNNETSTAYYRQMYQSYRTLPVLFASVSAIFLAMCVLGVFIFLAIKELVIPALLTLIIGGAFCVLVFLLTKHILLLALSPMVVLIDTVINIENNVESLLPEEKKAGKGKKANNMDTNHVINMTPPPPVAASPKTPVTKSEPPTRSYTEPKHTPRVNNPTEAKRMAPVYDRDSKPAESKHGASAVDEDGEPTHTPASGTPYYFEMACPNCKNTLSLDSRWDELNEFICPFCDTELNLTRK